jgi:ketosteroid isomerase-like protein
VTIERQAVRTAIGPDARLPRRRSLDERLFVRWPRAYVALARPTFLLPPDSRLRRGLLRRGVLSGWSAWSRGDIDLMLVRYARDCQFEAVTAFNVAGVRGSFRGHAGVREWSADLGEAWEQMRMTPLEILDAGDRVVVLGRWHTRGRGSGVEQDSRVGQAFWIERGLVVRDCLFLDWHEALVAAGMLRDAFADLRLASDGDAAPSG